MVSAPYKVYECEICGIFIGKWDSVVRHELSCRGNEPWCLETQRYPNEDLNKNDFYEEGSRGEPHYCGCQTPPLEEEEFNGMTPLTRTPSYGSLDSLERWSIGIPPPRDWRDLSDGDNTPRLWNAQDRVDSIRGALPELSERLPQWVPWD